MVELIPVAEASRGEFRWAPAADAYPYWIELNAKTSDVDVARLVATLADYNDIATSGALPAVIEALEAADELILPGGLLIRGDGLEIAPSGRSGLEDWREWDRVKPGGKAPWPSDDPAPRVECRGDDVVIWADAGINRAESAASATVSYQELGSAMGRAGEALDRLSRSPGGLAQAAGLERYAFRRAVCRRLRPAGIESVTISGKPDGLPGRR